MARITDCVSWSSMDNYGFLNPEQTDWVSPFVSQWFMELRVQTRLAHSAPFLRLHLLPHHTCARLQPSQAVRSVNLQKEKKTKNGESFFCFQPWCRRESRHRPVLASNKSCRWHISLPASVFQLLFCLHEEGEEEKGDTALSSRCAWCSKYSATSWETRAGKQEDVGHWSRSCGNSFSILFKLLLRPISDHVAHQMLSFWRWEAFHSVFSVFLQGFQIVKHIGADFVHFQLPLNHINSKYLMTW